ncbi:MAG: hypothetical protein AAF562_04270 [Pseudomonadota bacterium]
MKHTTILALSLSAVMLCLAASPSVAQTRCKKTKAVFDSSGRYAVNQQAAMKKDGLQRMMRVYIPEQQEYLADVSMREHYRIRTSFIEKQTRLWIRPKNIANQENQEVGPYQISKPTYAFMFMMTLKRHKEEELPTWAKRVVDKPLTRCEFYKNAEVKIYSGPARSNQVCSLPVNEKTKPKLAGLKFFEVRAMDLNNKEIYRGQYTIHYPQKVKDAIAQTSQAMDDWIVKEVCVPLGK